MEYAELKRKGRKLLEAGALTECYQMFEEALRLNPSDDRIWQKVKSLREALDERAEEQEDSHAKEFNDEMVELCPDFYLHQKIYSRLFEYQRDGLRWMYSLFKRKKGGILGDDMGLGKTVQVISFLAGLYDMEKISSVLLVMPVSLIGNWLNEFEKWAPGINVYDHHSGTKKEKEVVLRKVMNRGGVILTTYGMVTTRHEDLCQKSGRNFVWDYVILDEGHRIKNPTKTQKAVFELLAKHRIVLTGTAVQNNLRELWSLFHFTHQGTLFGNLAGFKQDFEGPINRGREKDAKAGEREMGVQLALQLKKMIAPYFLRRTKAEIFRTGQGPRVNVEKEDLVLWTFLSETQKELYQGFLQSESVKEILLTSKSPLVQLNILKKICDHPRLLPKKACVQLGLCDTMTEDEIREFLEDDKHCPFSIDDVSDEDLLNESGKMRLTLELTTNLRKAGHKTLIFSTSRRILDIIQRILRMRKFSIARLDGTITKPNERNDIVNDFQKRGKDVFLLTTQVGGVGLTLTNADRVIIYDPNWNPATDAQAVDRVFRIGQTKDVYVYRLITCGTIEEKIYSRQVFKDSIIKQTTGKHADPTRYFTRSQLRDLFVLNDPLRSETQEKLRNMHWKELTEQAEAHIEFLTSTGMVFGVSHHDLLFSTDEEKEEVSEDQRKFIVQQVERARVIREREADVVAVDLQRNPHVVPNLDMKSASYRNRAAGMPSTINPSDLHERPSLDFRMHENSSPSDRHSESGGLSNGTFIDLSQDDLQESTPSKHLHSTILEDVDRKGRKTDIIILDDDDDEISVIEALPKETKMKSNNVTTINDSDGSDEFEIEDVTPRHLISAHSSKPTGSAKSRRSADRQSIKGRQSDQNSKASFNERLSNAAELERSGKASTLSLSTCSAFRPRTLQDDCADDSENSPIVMKARARRLVIVSDDEHDEDNHAAEDRPNGKRLSVNGRDDQNTLKLGKSFEGEKAKEWQPLSFMQDSRAQHRGDEEKVRRAELSGESGDAQGMLRLSMPAGDGSANDKPASPTSQQQSLHTAYNGSTPNGDLLAVSFRGDALSPSRPKGKRRSVAVLQLRESDDSEVQDDDPMETEGGLEIGTPTKQVDEAEERQRAAEEAAYDQAFEDDEVDESMIEKTILESSLPLTDDGGLTHVPDDRSRGNTILTASTSAGYDDRMFVEDSMEDEDTPSTAGVSDEQGQAQCSKKSLMCEDDFVIEDSDEDL